MEESLFDNLKAIIVQYRVRFVKAFLMVFLSNLLLIINPFLFRLAIQTLDSTANLSSGIFENLVVWLMGGYQNSVIAWAIILLTIALLSGYFKYWMRIEFISISRDVERQTRSKLFERIQMQSRFFYDKHGIGELLSRLTNDIAAYRDVLGPGIMYPLFFLTLVIPGIIALFIISSKLALVSLVLLLMIPLINMSMRKQIFAYSLNVQKYLADMSNMVQEHYSGIRIIRSYVAESRMAERFFLMCRHLLTFNLKLIFLEGMFFPLLTLLTKLATIFLVLFAGMMILKGWDELNAGDFISFMWIQSYIFFPILMFAWILPMYEKGKASYSRLLEIYQEPIEVQEGKSKLRLHIDPKADLVIKDLTYRYPQAMTEALSHLNLYIGGGSFVGITGPVGAGKTTLFRLLNREYEVPQGKIFIGGHDIHEYSLEAFSDAVVTAEQIPFLFSKTIAENVRFGKEEATQEELENVAQDADLHETVLEFPSSYQTLVGERGMTLSGGQKQRVVMARAFLVDRSILLLDDIFSAVDAATEKRIFESIKKNFIGKTILLVTHNISILHQMDRVIYMDRGSILEDGTPQELADKKGYYAGLIELQSLKGEGS